MRTYSILIALLLFIACKKEDSNRTASVKEFNNSGTKEITTNNGNQTSGEEKLHSNKLIKDANIRIEVLDIHKAIDKLHILSQKYHGYLSNETQSVQDNSREISATIKIPAPALDSFIQDILVFAIKIDTKNLNTKDISEEFIDNTARLKTKKELEKTYLNLLKEAHNVSEVMSIEKELANVRADIESMESNLKYLNAQVRYATVDISCYQLIHPNSNLWKEISLGISGGWYAIIKFVILIFRVWPLLILLFILVYFGKIRNKYKK